MDWATLVFAAVAAVAAVLAAAWGWSDRPQHGWHVRMDTGDGSASLEKLTFTVRAVGTAVVHNVKVRVVGARHFESRTGLFQPQMGVGSEPIEVVVRLPKGSGEQAYVEIVWTRLRTNWERGMRVEIRSLKDSVEWETWRWQWRSIRLCPGPDGGPWWTKRFVFTNGDWVPDRSRPRAKIRPTGEAPDSSPAGDGGRKA